jgi:ABC-type multidrug transport system ATPase subunit
MIAPALVLSQLTKAFGRGRARVRALGGVSLDLVPGEIVGLVGPCGSGTTTLLRLAAGQLAPDAGRVILAGGPVRSWRARRLVGFAPEHATFPPTLTVRETLDYFARLHATGAVRRSLVAWALERGGLEPVAGQRASLLPLGWSRRLAFAQAALGERRVLLLDQTLTGLDPLARRDVGSELLRLAAAGTAVLVASRELDALERLAARVVVLHRGMVVREGALATLLRHRVLEIVLDRPPDAPPPGFRVTPTGMEIDLAGGTVEGALAVCRAHHLAVRASRVRHRSLEDALLEACDAAPR